MSDNATTPTTGSAGSAGSAAPAGTRSAAVVAIGLWVIVGAALFYGVWETVQKVSALFG